MLAQTITSAKPGNVDYQYLSFLLINTEVYIDDVSDAYLLLLAEEALKPNGGQAR